MTPRLRRTIGALTLLLILWADGPAARAEGPAKPVDFNRDVRPILSNACFACHGPDARKRKGVGKPLRLDTEAGATEDLGGYAAIVRGRPEESELIDRITADDDDAMPPKATGKTLSKHEVETLTEWVRQGAPYAKNWSYERPKRPSPPEVADATWPRNAIDRFILARLEKEGLRPSPEADRPTLIRRLSLDLIGLPPSPDEVDRFVRDRRPDAYEALVDRLLNSPAYGEHWGRLWLDLARYADSAGYADDPPRTIWAYRDYVIKSFNDNKPFDRFTVEQLAGDLSPNPAEEQLVATAFHRNTPTNNEGGTSDEEFRNVAVVDRVNTTFAVWMGTTIACAQCHDHKYDPISQKEYFQVFALLNNTADADRGDESPVVPLFSREQVARKAADEAEVARLDALLREPPADSVAGAEGFVPDRLATRHRLAALRLRLANAKPLTTVPVLRELPKDQRRVTRIQRRGNFLDLADEVGPGVPEAFPPLPAGTPRDRLALARWLVADENPLTSRVIANRYWEQLFGVGLVPTSEEFGVQGEPPSHPELLDWLATELVRDGWDLKRLLRWLATSATYRQESRVTTDLLHRDPDNRLLARGPRFRLPAEAVRDQALAVAGLLSPKLYGPPVKPPQPATGLTAAFGGGIDWQTSQGADRYRRGLYTTWRRSNPYPSMTTFDAPNREVCTLRRSRTNTPLQALVTLNDPVFVEAAQGLARRVVAGASTVEDRARLGVRLCLARDPKPEELSGLVRLYRDSFNTLTNSKEKALKLATDPIGPAPAGVDVADLAAWTVVGNVLLNLDETLMRR
ncbi:MAG TPA: PSD1 and planctomycete cytochrome C domain-containing protein [Isosphaeraceae bacterium]|jgi:mono/diheme cytochrome c family protein|nr:PSD1 and planctomycete cytochrome C domain-containing protein [Isosphaeraceae bacterium]